MATIDRSEIGKSVLQSAHPSLPPAEAEEQPGQVGIVAVMVPQELTPEEALIIVKRIVEEIFKEDCERLAFAAALEDSKWD